MTTGPTDGKVTTPAGGPGGMPLALPLSEGLGFTRRATRTNRLWCPGLALKLHDEGWDFSECSWVWHSYLASGFCGSIDRVEGEAVLDQYLNLLPLCAVT